MSIDAMLVIIKCSVNYFRGFEPDGHKKYFYEKKYSLSRFDRHNCHSKSFFCFPMSRPAPKFPIEIAANADQADAEAAQDVKVFLYFPGVKCHPLEPMP